MSADARKSRRSGLHCNGQPTHAGMAKLADAADLKSADQKWLWGFKSPSRHQQIRSLKERHLHLDCPAIGGDKAVRYHLPRFSHGIRTALAIAIALTCLMPGAFWANDSGGNDSHESIVLPAPFAFGAHYGFTTIGRQPNSFAGFVRLSGHDALAAQKLVITASSSRWLTAPRPISTPADIALRDAAPPRAPPATHIH